MSLTTNPKIYRPECEILMQTAQGGMVYRPTNIISVQTQSSLGAGVGTWRVLFNAEKHNKEGEGEGQWSSPKDSADGHTWDEVMIPGDYMEIRMARHGQDEFHTIMRGFLDSSRISQSGGPQPSVQVELSGRDYGSLPLLTSIFAIDPFTQTGDLLANEFGIKMASTTLPLFFEQLFNRVVRLYFDFRKGKMGEMVDYAIDDSSISPYGPILYLDNINPDIKDHTVSQLLRTYSTPPFFEFFVRDDDDKTTFFLRWPEIADSGGDYPTPLGTEQGPPARHEINGTDDWVEDTAYRQMRDVFNWFYVVQSKDTQNQASAAQVATPGENPYVVGPSIDDHGFKRMEVAVPFLLAGTGDTVPGITDDQMGIQKITAKMAVWLAKEFGHNEMLFSANIRVKGRWVYKVGDEVIVDGSIKFYLEAVQHEFTWGGTWTTTLGLTRGQPVGGLGKFEEITPFKFPFGTAPYLPGDAPTLFGHDGAQEASTFDTYSTSEPYARTSPSVATRP